MQKTFFLFISLFPVVLLGQNLYFNFSENNDIVSKFSHLSSKQLFDTANYYHTKNIFDTALFCYDLLLSKPVTKIDQEHQERKIEAMNKKGVIFFNMAVYQNAYTLWMDALSLCNKYNYTTGKSKILNNIGNIYFVFNETHLAEFYYLESLKDCTDTLGLITRLGNIGLLKSSNKQFDSALYYLNKALQLNDPYSKTKNKTFAFTHIAGVYHKKKQYDSALYYYKLTMEESKNNSDIMQNAALFTNFAIYFFEHNQLDSAIYYCNLSNSIATKHSLQSAIVENYKILSDIEKSKGNYKASLAFLEKHLALKDSITGTEKLLSIKQMQRSYEITKTNQQIEQLEWEQQINQRTIYYQKIIWIILLIVVLLTSSGLVIIYLQKRELGSAYKVLFNQSRAFLDSSKEIDKEQYRKSVLSDEVQHALLDKILTLMEDTSLICHVDFSIDKLAEHLGSNQSYVSQTINRVLKKNFSSFLNDYRIREALRQFDELDITKYSIESIAFQVGYKSYSGFWRAFKEVTGISPAFYIKSLKDEQNSVLGIGSLSKVEVVKN